MMMSYCYLMTILYVRITSDQIFTFNHHGSWFIVNTRNTPPIIITITVISIIMTDGDGVLTRTGQCQYDK